MAFLLKDTIHHSLVETVYNEILSRRSNYYYFIGNVLDWADPQNPDVPQATGDYERYTRNGILSGRQVPYMISTTITTVQVLLLRAELQALKLQTFMC